MIYVNLHLNATREILQIGEKYNVKYCIQFISIQRVKLLPTNKTFCDKIELNETTASIVTKTKNYGHM